MTNLERLKELKNKLADRFPSEYEQDYNDILELATLTSDDEAQVTSWANSVIANFEAKHGGLYAEVFSAQEQPMPQDETQPDEQPTQPVKRGRGRPPKISTPRPATQSQPMPMQTPTPMSLPTNMQDQTAQLVQAILGIVGQSQVNRGVDETEVRRIVEDIISNKKIGINELSSEVLAALQAVQQIKIFVPSLGYIQSKADNKPKSPLFWKVMDDVLNGNNVMLIGEAGTGKTYLAKEVASYLNRAVSTINCSQWTSPIEILGGYTMDGYEEGKLIKAWSGTEETGDVGKGHLLILDEMPKLDPNTAGLFNDALALTHESDPKRNKIQSTEGKSYSKGKDFGCIATGNVYPNKLDPKYAANNKQDASLLDRFSGSVYFVGYDEAIEKSLVNAFIFEVGTRLRQVIKDNGYEAVFSFRTFSSFQRAWQIEALRRMKNEKGESSGISPEEGKNFMTALDSFISTFNAPQQDVIRNFINYDNVKSQYLPVMLEEIRQGKITAEEPAMQMPVEMKPEN